MLSRCLKNIFWVRWVRLGEMGKVGSTKKQIQIRNRQGRQGTGKERVRSGQSVIRTIYLRI